MKHTDAENYVIENGRYNDGGSKGHEYFVRFPTQYSTTIFFSDDTLDLVEKVFKFGRTKVGRELWNYAHPKEQSLQP